MSPALATLNQAAASASSFHELTGYYQQLLAMYQSDITEIGTRMIAAANDYGFCGVYDKEVAQLNDDLYMPVAQRKREFSSLVTYSFTLEVRTSATDAEDARTLINEQTLYPTDALIEYLPGLTDVDVIWQGADIAATEPRVR